MTPQEEFISIYQENITRKGSEELLDWLKRTDFFTAPASSRYHCACEGGLVIHSVSVTICARRSSIRFPRATSRMSRRGSGKRCPTTRSRISSPTVTARNRSF